MEAVAIRRLGLILCFSVSLLAVVNVFPGRAFAQTPREIYQRAEESFWAEDYDRAEKFYRRLMDTAPRSRYFSDAQFGLARAYMKQGKLQKARQLFRRVRRNHPSRKVRGDALFSEAEIALLNDERSRARQLFKDFIQSHPEHVLRDSAEEKLQEIEVEAPAAPADASRPQADTTPGTQSESPETAADTQREREMSISPEAELPPEAPAGDTSSAFPEQLPPMKLSTGAETAVASETKAAAPAIPEQQGGTVADSRKSTEKQSPEKLREELRRLKRRNSSLLGELKQKVKQNRKFISLSKELQQRVNKLKGRLKELKERNERLRQELSRKITATLSDTRLYNLPEEIDLTDTAVQALAKNLDRLREQVKKAMQLGEYEVARNNIRKVLARNPQPKDYYNAARINWKLEGDSQPALKLLRTALEETDTVPIDYLLLKAEILSETQLNDRLDQFMLTWSDRISDRARGSARARWNLILAQRLIDRGKEDEAFFKLMNVVEAAPESDWAGRARKIIENEL